MQKVIKKVAKHLRLDENLIKDAQKDTKSKDGNGDVGNCAL